MYLYKQDATGKHYRTDTLIDQRELLKIKAKSLAAEAKIIREQERKAMGSFRDVMRQHRIGELRAHARDTYIAYGLIKGRTYEQIESHHLREPNWDNIQKMLDRYGPWGKDRITVKDKQKEPQLQTA